MLRSIETLSQVELDGVDRGGAQGEYYAETMIADGPHACYIRNPLIPHPTKRGIFLETDFLVYMQGSLYCVEVKNYRGRVYYPPRYRTVLGKRGWFIFQRQVPQLVFDGYDYSK